MKSKTIFFLIVFSIFVLFSTACFAEDNMMNNISEDFQNTMQNEGNMIKDTANGMANGVKDGVNGVANAMGNMGATVMDSMDMNNNNDNYTAERTATTGYTNEGTFLGLNSTAWTWIVMGIVAATVIGLIIYYNTQKDYDRNRSRDRNNY